jgi:hypothetical protein
MVIVQFFNFSPRIMGKETCEGIFRYKKKEERQQTLLPLGLLFLSLSLPSSLVKTRDHYRIFFLFLKSINTGKNEKQAF